MGKHAMNFLFTKSWHVGSMANQKKKWEAEQRAQDEEKRRQEHQRVLEQEAASLEAARALATASGRALDASAEKVHSLAFMYQPPPGYLDMQQRQQQQASEAQQQAQADTNAHDKAKPTPGDGACGEKQDAHDQQQCARSRSRNPHDDGRLKREDPMMSMLTSITTARGDVKLEGTDLMLKGSERAVAAGAYVEEESDVSDVERKFLASLTPGQKKRLLKRLRKDARRAGKKDRDKRKRH
eukprot:m51a1_g3467 hypothetical protein (240) ;mRNA; f:739765-740752